MTLASLFVQSEKSTNTSSVSEQNTIGGSEQDSFPIGTLGDAFSQILQDAFGGNTPHLLAATNARNPSQNIQQKNSPASEQIDKGQIQTASAPEAISITVPATTNTTNEEKLLPVPIVEEANENVKTALQSSKQSLAHAASDDSQTAVGDISATNDAQAGTSSSKPKLASKGDKAQAEPRPLANGRQQLQSAADQSAVGALPITTVNQATPLVNQMPPLKRSSVQISSTQVFPTQIASTAATTVSNNGSQVVSNTASQQASPPWTGDDNSEKNVFHLSLQSTSPQDLKPEQTGEITQQSTATLPPQPKAIQTAGVGSQHSTDHTNDAISTDPETVPAAQAASGSNPGMNSDSEPSSPKINPLTDKDHASTDGEKKNEPTDHSLAGTTFALGSSPLGFALNSVGGKEAAGPSQSSAVNRPTDLQQLATEAPAKEVTVRLQGHSGETISIRLTDQSGQVQVAVRSSDPGSVASLRQDLSSLTSSLDRIGWKTEVSNNVMASSNMSGHDSSGSGNNSRDDSRSGSPDWEQGSRRQRNTTPELWDEILYRQSN